MNDVSHQTQKSPYPKKRSLIADPDARLSLLMADIETLTAEVCRQLLASVDRVRDADAAERAEAFCLAEQ
ncbi:MAG: hypothetical protein AAGB11_09020 [Pseudomonadota bacterium]